MSANPWERLREAAKAICAAESDVADWLVDHETDTLPSMPAQLRSLERTREVCIGRLREALAALPAAPPQPDPKRERAIEAWRKSATDTKSGDLDDVFEVHIDTINEAIALMRSAPAPKPADPAPPSDHYEEHLFHDDAGMPTARCRVCNAVYKEAGFVPCQKPPKRSYTELAKVIHGGASNAQERCSGLLALLIEMLEARDA